ncbi:MAG: opioid growth factor receptor-related protein [Allosphingosinicella sp.]
MREAGSPVVQFLQDTGTESRGQTIAEILALGDNELECRHDYIQWLFPLGEPSQAVPGSPVLDVSDIEVLTRSAVARRNLAAAADRMRRFYLGNAHWLCPYDHNHLRITRIISSLRLLVGDNEADEFRKAMLEQVARSGHPVNARSLAFWAKA